MLGQLAAICLDVGAHVVFSPWSPLTFGGVVDPVGADRHARHLRLQRVDEGLADLADAWGVSFGPRANSTRRPGMPPTPSESARSYRVRRQRRRQPAAPRQATLNAVQLVSRPTVGANFMSGCYRAKLNDLLIRPAGFALAWFRQLENDYFSLPVTKSAA